MMYQVDSELASDESELIQDTPREKSVARGFKRGIIATCAIFIIALASIGLFVNRKGGPVSWTQTGNFMEKADAKLEKNKEKFNVTIWASKIYAAVKDKEGHDMKPIRSAERLGFNGDDLASLHKAFKVVDENKDGDITGEELEKKLNDDLGFNIHGKEIKKMIEEGDKYGNDDGQLQFDAFANLWKMAQKNGLAVDEEVFNAFDANKDKFVDLNEAWKMQKGVQDGGDSGNKMGKNDLEDVFRFVDKNGDGKVSMKEAKEAFQ